MFLPLLPTIASFSCAMYAEEEKRKTKRTRDLLELVRSTPEEAPLPSGHLAPEDEGKLVFLRGVVLPLSHADNNLFGLVTESQPSLVKPLRSSTTRQEAVVVVDQTQHISYVDSIQSSSKVVSKKRLEVPFVIASRICNPCDECVLVDLDGRENKIPLVKVLSDRRILFTYFHRGEELRVDMVREEEILPLGTVISALGELTTKNGIPTIKPSKISPYFLTTKSKDELVEELEKQVDEEDLGVFLSQMSVCLAFFAAGSFFTYLARSSR